MEPFEIEHRALEAHQLEPRFAPLRLPDPRALQALERSLALAGQLQALIAVPAEPPGTPAPYVLLDGYRRLEALRRLECDTARVEIWHCPLAQALPRVLTAAQARGWAPLEEALLLQTLAIEHGLSQHELARRTGRDVSWVSRRLKLLGALSGELLEAVCAGAVSTWAASRILGPWGRANPQHARALLGALAREPLPTRDLVRWYRHYSESAQRTRERLVEHPALFVAALESERNARQAQRLRAGPEGQWQETLERIAAQLARLRQALPRLCTDEALPPELAGALARVRHAWLALERQLPHPPPAPPSNDGQAHRP
jgi:ParB family transcriptional regulator, chromosome partitioning protein